MDRGRGSGRPYRSASRGGRGGFRSSGYSSRGSGRGGGSGGFYSKRGSDGPSDRGRSRGRGDSSYSGGRRYESERFREAPSMYSARDYDRPTRRALTPPAPVDRVHSNGDRDRFDRYSGGMSDYRPPIRDSMELRGARDFDSRRALAPSQRPGLYMDIPDYPVTNESYARQPVGRDYVPASVTGRRYSPPEMRDIDRRREVVREISMPSREYESLRRSHGYGDFRDMPMSSTGRSGYPGDTYARRAPSPFDDPRSREVRTRRMSPPTQRYDRDDGPPMKRSRGGPPISRGGRGRGGFAPRRGRQSRRF